MFLGGRAEKEREWAYSTDSKSLLKLPLFSRLSAAAATSLLRVVFWLFEGVSRFMLPFLTPKS